MEAFDAYTLLLMVSGGLLVVMAGTISGPSKAARIINLLVGLAFFGYGFYLEFLFSGGSYFIFFYAFILPILLVVNTFKARKAARDQAQQGGAQAYAQQLQAPGQPGQPGQPGAGPQGYPGQPGYQGYPQQPQPPQQQQPQQQQPPQQQPYNPPSGPPTQ